MFVVRGEAPSEAALVETRLGVENLRTRGSFLVLGTGCGKLYLWHGAQCCRHARRVATHAARAIVQRWVCWAARTRGRSILLRPTMLQCVASPRSRVLFEVFHSRENEMSRRVT